MIKYLTFFFEKNTTIKKMSNGIQKCIIFIYHIYYDYWYQGCEEECFNLLVFFLFSSIFQFNQELTVLLECCTNCCFSWIHFLALLVSTDLISPSAMQRFYTCAARFICVSEHYAPFPECVCVCEGVIEQPGLLLAVRQWEMLHLQRPCFLALCCLL